MKKKEKIRTPLQETLALLQSAHAAEQKKGINLCRTLGDPETILPLLKLLTSPHLEAPTQRVLINLLADITHAQFSVALQEHLQSPHSPEHQALLLSLTWQNAGDCTPLIPQLIQAMRSPHMEVVIEAMTGLEVNMEKIPSTQIRTHLTCLKDLAKEQPLPPHHQLINETISLLSQILTAVESAEREYKKMQEE